MPQVKQHQILITVRHGWTPYSISACFHATAAFSHMEEKEEEEEEEKRKQVRKKRENESSLLHQNQLSSHHNQCLLHCP